MASIQEHLDKIKNAIFGKDVRQAIHDSIEECYRTASVDHDNANMEVKRARGTHETLNDRLVENEKKQENLSAQLEHITNITNGKTILISAFNGRNKEELDLYLTKDGVELTALNSFALFEGQVRDPYIIYKGGYFYCSYTRNASKGFGISKTKDLISWEHFFINTNCFNRCWAPELFEYNGKVYVIMSLQSNNEVENDKYGQSIPYLKQYYSEINLSTMTIGAINEITYSKTSNKIDSTMIIKDNYIYCFVKNEYSKQMEVYKASSLSDNFIYQYTVDYPLDVEGASLSFDGKKYHLIMDCFYNKFTVHSTSTDLVNWGTFNIVGDGKTRVQHPSQLILTNEIKEKINNYYTKNITKLTTNILNNKEEVVSLIRASHVISNNVLTIPNDGSVIGVYGNENFIVNKIEGNAKRFYVTVYASKENKASITFIQGNNIFTPNGRDLVINADNGNNEALIEVKKIANTYRFLTNDKLGVNPNLVNLSTLASGGVIENLELENNATYYVDGTHSITINSTSFKRNGDKPFRCYFSVWSVSSKACITIKNSGKIITPNSSDFIIRGNTSGDVVYEFSREYVSPSQASLRVKSYKNNDNLRINLNTIATSGSIISNFNPINGALYTCGGAEQFTISGIVDNLPDGHKFYLGLFTNNTSAFIKLQTGDNIEVPTKGYTIDVNGGKDGLIIEVVKMNGTSFRVKGF